MAPYDDAVKAAAEALSEYYEGDGWGYFGGAAEAAVTAAAPILLADERAEVERLREAARFHDAIRENADIAGTENAALTEALHDVQRRADASRTAHAALVADLRALCDPLTSASTCVHEGRVVVVKDDVLALLDRLAAQIAETAPDRCPHGVDPNWCDACFDVALAETAPEEGS